MRKELWSALRRIDFSRAARLLSEEIDRLGELDEHLLLAAFDLEQLAGAPVGLPWRTLAESSRHSSLYLIAERFFQHDWPRVLALRNELANALSGDAAAFANGFAMRAAYAIGDLAAARAVATETVARHPANSFVLYLALCLELESPFLSCPDLLLVDLSTHCRSEEARFYLDSSWPAVAHAVSAWLYHRDGNRAQALAEIEAFYRAAESSPIDAVLAAPFFRKLQPTLASNLLAGVPLSSPMFLEAHLVHGLLSEERKVGILQEAATMDPLNPFFRLEVVLQHLPPRGGRQSLEDLADLLAACPWYQAGFKAAIQVGVALRDQARTVQYALALLAQSSSCIEAFDWIVTTLEKADWYDTLANVVAAATAPSEWQEALRGRTDKALGLLALGGRTDEVARVLNEWARTITGEDAHDALLRALMTRDGRLAIEALPEPDCLCPEAAILCVEACLALGLFSLARLFLTSLREADSEEASFRRSVELLARLCDFNPAVRVDSQDLPLLENYLSMLAGFATQELEIPSDSAARSARIIFVSTLGLSSQRLLQNGRHHQALWLLRFGAAKLPQPDVIIMAAEVLLEEVKDPGTALALLDKYAEVVKETPESLRIRCVTLEKLDRTQEWLRAAREARARFLASPEFIIEEGLALAALGEMPVALDVIYQGLVQCPDDERGLDSFKTLAPRFDAHLRLLTILEAALEENPEESEIRDAIILLLGTIENCARERLRHLYRRVHRETVPDETKRTELQEMLTALRRRLLSQPVVPGLRLARFAEENIGRARATIAELQPVLTNRIIASVFAEIEVSAEAGEEKHWEPVLILTLQTNDLLDYEYENLRSITFSVLRTRNYRGRIEVYGMKDVWDAVRRADRSILDNLLNGVPAGDFAFLNTLRMADAHCRLILEKFERYVVCYAIAGSFVRGTQRIDSDVDVWMVIDDSDLRTMSRVELREKLREISDGFREKVRREFAHARVLNVQTYILSSFWISLQAADPIILSLIRDGVPIYDRGLFNAWARLLRDGYLRSTRESLDGQLKEVESLHNAHTKKIRQFAADLVEPIKYGTVKMLEILLQVLDLPVGHYRQVIELAAEEIVGRRALLTNEDLEVARKAIAYVKAVETGTIPPLEEALQLFRRVEDFMELTRAIYRQLLAEKDRADLAEMIPRIDAVLSTADDLKDDGPWRQRLIGYRDAAYQALEAPASSDLGAVRVTALVARIAEVALSIKLLEAQRSTPLE